MSLLVVVKDEVDIALDYEFRVEPGQLDPSALTNDLVWWIPPRMNLRR
jgi:hypothetical protein